MAKDPLEENEQSTEMAKEVQEVQSKAKEITFNIAGVETKVFRAADGLLSIDKEELQEAISQQMQAADDWKEQAEQAKKSLIDATFENIDQAIKTINFVLSGLREAGLLTDEPPLPEPLSEDEKTLLETIRGMPKKYTGIKTNRYIMPNNPLANALTGRTDKNTGEILPIINSGEFDLPVGKGDLTAYTIVTTDDSNIKIEGRPYTWYDRGVSNAVISLWRAGNDIVYPEQICRFKMHKTESEKVSPQQVGAVTRSLEKHRRTHVYIDLSDEMKKRGVEADGEKVEEYIIDDFLLSLTGVTIKVGGHIKKAYKIQKEPILFTYSKLTGQIITTPTKLLDIKKIDKTTGKSTGVSIPETERRSKIKDYLLWRIEVMKNDRKNKRNKQSTHISYETLYKETDTPIDKKQQRQKTRDDALTMCAFWKAESYINGFSEYPPTGRKQGINIEL